MTFEMEMPGGELYAWVGVCIMLGATFAGMKRRPQFKNGLDLRHFLSRLREAGVQPFSSVLRCAISASGKAVDFD